MSFTDSKPSYQEREEIEILLVFFSTDFALVDRMALFFKRIIIRSVFVDFTMWTSTLNDPSFFLLPAFHEVSQGDGTVCNCVFFLLLFFL